MAEGSNKITNILLGAAIVTLGYAIYQTYTNEITANADNIKNKLKNLFSKKTKEEPTTTTESIVSSTKENCHCNEKQLDNAEHLNIYVQQENWNDIPKQMSTEVVNHFDIDNSIGEKALQRISGNQSTRI
jgi:Tfp pilus assembly protein PilO